MLDLFWVSRSRYQECWTEMQDARKAMRAAEEKSNALVATLRHEHERYDNLLEKYHALRLMGGAPERKLEPLPIAQRDEIADAIELAAGNDGALQRHLNRFAKQQKLDGASEHDIIQAIIHWRSDDDDLDSKPRMFGVL